MAHKIDSWRKGQTRSQDSYDEIETLELQIVYLCWFFPFMLCLVFIFPFQRVCVYIFSILEVILLSSNSMNENETKQMMMPVQQYVRHKSTQITKHLESILVKSREKKHENIYIV